MKADIEDYSEMVSIMKGRAAIYEYFFMIFKGEPDKRFLGLSEKFVPYFESIREYRGSKEILEGTVILRQYVDFENSFKDKAELLDRLAVQYSSLFFTGAQAVQLTESVHTTPERINKQEAWEDALLFYHTRGFKAPESFKEPEDHIAIELLFMKSMSALASELLEKGDEDICKQVLSEELKFLDKHILNWAPIMCKQMYKKASDKGALLYSATAKLTDGFLKIDSEFLRLFIDNQP